MLEQQQILHDGHHVQVFAVSGGFVRSGRGARAWRVPCDDGGVQATDRHEAGLLRASVHYRFRRKPLHVQWSG